jgi:hypothetical protein
MIDIKSRKCLHPDCKVQPFYNYENESRAIYCMKHKLTGMIDIKNKKCVYSGCKVIPNYNYENESRAIYCVKHKLTGMIDIKNKKCLHPDCYVLPICNYENETKFLYCNKHKLPGMIDIKSKRCLHPECKIRPIFNYETETKGLFCAKHKKEGMVNIMSKRCIHPECKIIPNYNYENETQGLYCTTHKKEGMIDIKHKICKTFLCSTIVQKKYDGYCLYCYIHLFPNTPLSRNYKTKESAVTTFIKKNNPDYDFQIDKKILDGCSKRRPDLLLDLGYQIIIIEIDENKHANYDCTCENKRIMEISQDLAHRPIVFIRFNPDSYEDHESEISSCWHVNTKGFCVVKKSKQKEWEQRLNTLDETLKYWIDPANKTSKMVEIIELFY